MQSHSVRRIYTTALTLAGLLLAFAPFTIPHIPVGTDTLKHVLVAHILSHFHDPLLHYSESFQLGPAARPTAPPVLILAALERFLEPFAALKVFLCGFVILLWAGGLRLLRSQGAPALAAVIFLPLTHMFWVFSGLLPYAIAVALFPFFVAYAVRPRRTISRIAGLTGWLLLLYAFHIVGAAAGCLTLVVLSVKREEGTWNVNWHDLFALIPTGLVCLLFVSGRDSSAGHHLYYFAFFTHLKSYWAYNVSNLSRVSSVLTMAALALLAAVVLRQYRRGRASGPLLLVAILLIVIGTALPYQIDDWFLVGSRTLPFALIAAIGSLRMEQRSWHIAAGVAMILMVVSSAGNTRASLNVQPQYDEFLSGMQAIPYGSRILPFIADPALGGNQYIQAFDGIEDAYNIYRGGSNPYVMAAPRRITPADPRPDPSVDPAATGGVLTGATLLKFRYPALYAYKYLLGPRHYHGINLRGAGLLYDYFVLYGALPDVEAALEPQARLVFTNGDLRIYESLNHAEKRPHLFE